MCTHIVLGANVFIALCVECEVFRWEIHSHENSIIRLYIQIYNKQVVCLDNKVYDAY